MNKFKRESIQFDDINEYIPDEVNSFTQINLSETLILKDSLPPLGEVLKVKVIPEVKNTRIAKTAIGVSLEGQKLTGFKYLIEGFCSVRVDYFTNEKGGLIYTFKNLLPFNSSIALPENVTTNCKFLDSIHLEDVYSEIINIKELLINISCLFIVEEY